MSDPVYYTHCEQGSAEWLALRAGIPTASEFHRIVTPKTAKLSKQADGYMRTLLAEIVVGHPISGPETAWMDRGIELEDGAVKAYEFQTGIETQSVAFVSTWNGQIGASPDRLIGEDRLLEIKCPKESTQVGYMLTGQLEEDYFVQLQGQLLVTGRQGVDIVSYHPEMPSVVMKIERNETFIDTLHIALKGFVEVMAKMRETLETKFGPFREIAKSVPERKRKILGPEFYTDFNDWMTRQE